MYDNRTLTILLERLSNQLRSLQPIDQKSITGALSNFQGSRATDTALSVSVSGPSLPAIQNQTTLASGTTSTTTGTSGDNATVTAPTASNQVTTSTPQNTHTAPALPDPAAETGSNLAYGPNAADLLTDQLNLSYQVLNLEMILERSLTDRLLGDQPRLQAVLGFNVSIDPPAYAKDCAAVVEVTVENQADSDGSDFSLVAMMPQEKTYNAATLNSKSRAFAGSAVVQAVNLGVAARKSQRVMYLYRDNDTLSYENMPRDQAGSLQFGWVFRPVLGRRSVSPGLRQMFAVVALPAFSAPGTAAKNLRVTVKTSWKKYKAGDMTTFTAHQVFGWDAWRHFFVGSEALKQKYLNQTVYKSVEVKNPDQAQQDLQPNPRSVDWTYTGARSTLVTLRGTNFFTGTSVLLGGKVYKDTRSGLVIKSENEMDLLTDVDSLANSSGVIEGRYGGAAPVYYKPAGKPPDAEQYVIDLDQPLGGYRDITVSFAIDQCDSLPKMPDQDSLRMPLILLDATVVSDNATIRCEQQRCGRGTGTIRLHVKDEALHSKAPLLRIVYPFYPPEWNYTYPIPDRSIVFTLDRLSKETNAFILRAGFGKRFGSAIQDSAIQAARAQYARQLADEAAKKLEEDRVKNAAKPASASAADRGKSQHTKPRPAKPKPARPVASLPIDLRPDSNCWTLFTGPGQRVLLPGGDLERGTNVEYKKPPVNTCKKYDGMATYLEDSAIFIADLPAHGEKSYKDRFLLVNPGGSLTYPISVPPAKAEAKKASIDKLSPIINQYDARWVPITGSNLSAIDAVRVNGGALDIQLVPMDKDGDKETLKINITRAITEKAGTVDIAFLDASKKVIDTVPLQIVCKECGGTSKPAK